MGDTKSADSKSSSSLSFGGSTFKKYLQIVCVLILVVFVLYLTGSLTVSLENARRRWLSNKALNLDVKLSLLFELSHLLSLPFVLYSFGKDILQGGSNET